MISPLLQSHVFIVFDNRTDLCSDSHIVITKNGSIEFLVEVFIGP